MVSLKIIDVKGFMKKLLTQDVFDNFDMVKMEIITYNYFSVEGKINKKFFPKEELELLDGRKYSRWSEIRPIGFQLMKGKKTPLFFKIVLILSLENTAKLLERSGVDFRLEDVNGVFLNIKYENCNLNLVTGSSIKLFSMNKAFDLEWDNELKLFLRNCEIAYEEE